MIFFKTPLHQESYVFTETLGLQLLMQPVIYFPVSWASCLPENDHLMSLPCCASAREYDDNSFAGIYTVA